MIAFSLNGRKTQYLGDETTSLLTFLREERGIISVKDGCSGQAACGACLTEVDGKPVLACATPMKRVDGKEVVTIEGFPEHVRRTLARAFVAKGAVQCGYCTPGMLSRAKILLEQNPDPGRSDVVKALNANICRCTGYVKIIDAILLAAQALREGAEIPWEERTGIGCSSPKHGAYEEALGIRPYVDDMRFEGMLYGVLKFSAHPRAKVLRIDVSAASMLPGVIRVFTTRDIPGRRHQGLLVRDWPMMVAEDETTRCIGDVVAAVVARARTWPVARSGPYRWNTRSWSLSPRRPRRRTAPYGSMKAATCSRRPSSGGANPWMRSSPRRPTSWKASSRPLSSSMPFSRPKPPSGCPTARGASSSIRRVRVSSRTASR